MIFVLCIVLNLIDFFFFFKGRDFSFEFDFVSADRKGASSNPDRSGGTIFSPKLAFCAHSYSVNVDADMVEGKTHPYWRRVMQ